MFCDDFVIIENSLAIGLYDYIFFFYIDCLYVYINSAILAYYFIDKHLYCFFLFKYKNNII